jgi:hypothetical protein
MKAAKSGGTRAPVTLAGGGDPGGDEAFEDGLLMIVDGIAAGLERDRTA